MRRKLMGLHMAPEWLFEQGYKWALQTHLHVVSEMLNHLLQKRSIDCFSQVYAITDVLHHRPMPAWN